MASGQPVMTRPTFTVLVPTYGRAHLLPRSLTSVLQQTWTDFELLVIDDASEDTTSDVVASMVDPRVRYLRRATNGGGAAARNTGLAVARGRYIALLDDDDEFLPGFLTATHQALAASAPEVGFAWSGRRWLKNSPKGLIVDREEIWLPSFRNRREAYRGFLINRGIGACGLVFRSSVLDTIGGFDEEFQWAEDTDFLIRLAHHFDFRVVREILVQIHLHDGPKLRGNENPADYERLILKNKVMITRDHEVAAAMHYKAGWLYYHRGQRREGRRHLLRVLQEKPGHLRTWAALLLFESFGSRGTALHRRVSALLAVRRRISHMK